MIIPIQWLGKNKNEWVFEPRIYKITKLLMSVSSTALLTDKAIAGHGLAVITLKYLYNGRSIGNDYSVRRGRRYVCF